MTGTSTMTLRSAAEVALGRQRSPQHADGEHMVRYLRAANVKDGTLDLADVQSMNFTPAEQSIFALRPGDVLVSEGSGSLSSVGASVVWRGELDGMVCFQNTLLRLRPRAGVDGRYLEWWARSAFGSGVFASIASGANIYHLSAERVRALLISLPPLEEQRRIADFLDAETGRVERLISLQRRIAIRLEEREAAQLDIAIDKQRDLSGVLPLRRFLWGVDQGTSPQCDAVPAGEDEWGVLKVSCLRPGEFLAHENKRLPASEQPMRRSEVHEGDLLITRANTPQLVGSTAVVPKVRSKLLLSDKIFRVRLRNGLDPEYVATVARGTRIRSLCSATSNGASQSMANIRFAEVKSWPIPVVGLSEQRDFIEKVNRSREQINALRSTIMCQINLLAERRQALIIAAVTGQIDVSTASGRGIEE